MRKKMALSLAIGFTFLTSTSAFASSPGLRPDRPSNATPNAPMVHTTPVGGNAPKMLTPSTEPGTHYEQIYTEPSTISVSIYQRDSTGAEIQGTYSQTVTVPFEQYVKDVLPNEWMESWGNVSGGINALEAGALAVKTYGWYHVLNPKDSLHNADVTNGTSSQMYTAGSGANSPNCTSAVNDVSTLVLGDSNGDLWETPYLATAPNNGYTMSQNGTLTDAESGLNYQQIISKWYYNQPFTVVGEVQLVAN